jgi:hypothetical protein
MGLLSELYGYPIHAVTTRDAAGQVTGYLPLLQVASPLSGRRLVSLPFSDYTPFLAASAEAAENLLRQAVALAAEQRCRSIELRSGLNEWLARGMISSRTTSTCAGGCRWRVIRQRCGRAPRPRCGGRSRRRARRA